MLMKVRNATTKNLSRDAQTRGSTLGKHVMNTPCPPLLTNERDERGAFGEWRGLDEATSAVASEATR
jgi:hypothetical protein